MTQQAKKAIKKARVWRTIPEGDIETIADGCLFLNTGKFLAKFTDIPVKGGIVHSLAPETKNSRLRDFKPNEIDSLIRGLDAYYNQFSNVLKAAKYVRVEGLNKGE